MSYNLGIGNNLFSIFEDLYRAYNIYVLYLFPFYKKVKIVLKNLSFNIYGTKLFKNYGIGKDFSINSCHEPICSEYLITCFKNRPKSIFWDCGSSIGYYSVLAKYASRNKAVVHAFEANCLYNKYVKKSMAEFTEGVFVLNNTIISERNKQGCLSLDDYARDHGLTDIIKMDIDGSELRALKGMQKIFELSKPLLMLEVHFYENYLLIRKIIQQIIPQNKYSFSLCMNHRYHDARWTLIDNLDELPITQQSYMRDPDYILLCEPARLKEKK